MLATLVYVLAAWCVLAAVVSVVAVGATVLQVRQRPRTAPVEWPPVSMVKPMKGADEALAANLESFFALRYPAPVEIVFACADAKDPAVAVACEVAARHAEVPVRFVQGDPDAGLNPKIANLVGALPVAQHDLIFQTDANVRVAPDHLTNIVAEFVGENAGLLSSLIVGAGEKSTGAALDNVHLTTVIAPSVAFASRVGRRAVVVGKALLYRNRELRALGGIEQFKDVLAEDYLMGECYERAGRRVVLSSHTIQNVNERCAVSAYVARQSRWLKMNAVINPLAFLLRFLISPMWAIPLVALGSWTIGFGTIIVFLLGQQTLFRVLRRQWMGPRLMALALLDTTLMWAAWPYSAVSRKVSWRGEELVIGGRTRLRKRV